MDEKKVREEEYLEFPWGIEDTIENLRELKSILQKQVREEDCDGKGTQDAFELGFDFDRAIEALEKQLPKKAKENGIRGGWLGKQKHYTCPNCGNCLLTEMMNERQNTSYCWDCGQRLDWSEK